MNVYNGTNARIERVDRGVRERLGRCLYRPLAVDVIGLDVATHHPGVVTLVSSRDVSGLGTADHECIRIAFADADVAETHAVLRVIADEALFAKPVAPGIEFFDGFCRQGGGRLPVAFVFCIALVDHEAAPARSGNSFASSSSLASHTPRSVISPVTSLAGVTSNASFLTGEPSGTIRTLRI